MTPEQTALENVLADMFREVSTAGRIADMAGLDVAQVDRTGSSADVWHSIVCMAIQDGVLEALVERARTERPRTQALAAAWKRYQDAAPTPKRATSGRSTPPMSDSYRQSADGRIDQMMRDMSAMQIQIATLQGQVATLLKQNEKLMDMLQKRADDEPQTMTGSQLMYLLLAIIVAGVLIFGAVYLGGRG